jgi:V/A-type H+/Na+-transporting ATPase subunit E
VVSMGLEKVIEKIQKEGEEKISTIRQDADKQAAQILQTTKKNIEEVSLKKKQETEKQIESMKNQEISGIEIEEKKIRLNAEKDILNKTYQDCLIALQALPHEKIITSMLKMAKKELPTATVIYSNKRDEPLVRSQSIFSYGGTIECLGGIVVENPDKTITLDYRYETIATTVWDHSMKEIADKLFR